jgi:hypothetical protein
MGKIRNCIFMQVCFLILLMPFAFLSAQPRTLYKPKDIENARKNIEKHQWARSIAADRWAGKTEFARQQERRFFEDFIPELTPPHQLLPPLPCLP